MLTIIVGGFFGDEGKGSVTAYLALADDADVAVRCGSVNAGHTVVWRGVEYRLRIVPAAFVNPSTRLLVAPGALVRLDLLFEEMERTGTRGRLFLDEKTGVIEERHIAMEAGDENLAKRVGSTLQGVGAATADRVLRRLRLAREFEELRGMLTDVSGEVVEKARSGETVLVEGTQGTFLSLYHGTYPYVTSRDTTASAFASEVGIGPKDVDEVLVVFKSYVTRVGEGPLAGELSSEEAAKRGWVERGTVTGRPRRVAPFNVELARRAVMLNSATQAAVTKLDALFASVKCTRSWEKLPLEARRWVEEIENSIGVPVTLIGTGRELDCIVDRRREAGGL